MREGRGEEGGEGERRRQRQRKKDQETDRSRRRAPLTRPLLAIPLPPQAVSQGTHLTFDSPQITQGP